MTRPLAYLAILALAACQQQCPRIAVKPWTREEQGRMLAEERTLPDDSILIPALEDYARLRRQAR